MSWFLCFFVVFVVGCGGEEGAAGRAGGGESEPPQERLAVLEHIGELALYQMVGTPYERRVQIGKRNLECEQITPQNFEEHWPDFDSFAEECLEPDFVLINNALDPRANQIAVRAFTPRRTDEVSLTDLKPEVDFEVTLSHFYDGSDYEDDMNNAFWEFIEFSWSREGEFWILDLKPKTDRLALRYVHHDPTAYLDVCIPEANACSESTLVLGVNPSLESAWEVTEGPAAYAADSVLQFDREIQWDFAGAGSVVTGTFEFGELKVSFDAGAGPAGVEGSGSFRVAEVVSADELSAFFQHSTPGEGQTSGDIKFRRVRP